MGSGFPDYTDFEMAVVGHGTCSLTTDPEDAHTLYPRGKLITSVCMGGGITSSNYSLMSSCCCIVHCYYSVSA